MAAPVRLTVLTAAFTRLLLDVLTGARSSPSRAIAVPGPAHAVGPGAGCRPRRAAPILTGPAAAMSEPTGARRSDPQPPAAERGDTRPFAAPVPPPQQTGRPPAAAASGSAAEPVPVTPVPRRPRLVRGAAAPACSARAWWLA